MSFLLAVQFLTIIPVRLRREITEQDTARAMAWFPVVGSMLGLILALSDRALGLLFSPLINSGLLLVLWVVLTGALHLDGFLDCCDGLLAARSPEERLKIMRDTNTGAFAVVGAFCLLLLKFLALNELDSGTRPYALIAILPLTRAAMVLVARAFPYARKGPGLGQMFRQELTWLYVIFAGFIAFAVAFLALGIKGLILGVIVGLLAIIISLLVQRRIPGLTGDVYGMINELAELGALFALVIHIPL
jgi:adenosylcobinamide-GDP ribazoletransferase